jgi:DNA-directed RNA polymerase specialized sigma24 family protein
LTPSNEETLALDRPIDRLEAIDPRRVRVLEPRYFLGCTSAEAAEVPDVSRATVERDPEFSKAWLRRRLWPRMAPDADS